MRRLLVLASVLLAGCGGGAKTPPRVAHLGTGPTSAWVFRPAGPSKGVVLFLHGWGAFDPAAYRPWIDHLTAGGRTVVYPQYQGPPFLSPGTAFASVLQGVARAVRDGHLPTTGWVVTGHSAGGAMSADYAAAARRFRVPVPRAVVAFYPGRRIRRIPLGIPSFSLATIPRATELVAVAGDHDETVGTDEARRIARETGARYLLVHDDAIDDHLAPQQAGAGSYFWRVLDSVLSGSRPSQVPDAP